MKKVLMLLFEFSPTGYTGSFRATSFAKYLRDFGWEPIIITVEKNEDYGYLLNQSEDSNYPQDLKIYKTKVLKKFFINEWGFRWLPYLIPRLIKVVKSEKPDLLYITCPPYYELLTGYLIKKLFGIPYVLDYRDGWLIGWSYDDDFANSKLSLKGCIQKVIVSKWIQSLFLKEAEKAILVSDLLKRAYNNAFPDMPKNKFLTITNGFDPDDFKLAKANKSSKFTIVYTGRFHAFRDPKPFLTAFKTLLAIPEIYSNIQFIHVGPRDENLSKIVVAMELNNHIQFVGMAPHQEALSYLKGADLLLLINGLKESLPGKFFDYLGIGKPILILGLKEGELFRLSKNFTGCFFIENKLSNVDEMTAAIEMFYARKGNSNIHPDWNHLRRYNRKYLTGQLSQLFDEVICKNKSNKIIEYE